MRDTGPTRRTRDLVHLRSGGMCERCEMLPAEQIHHRAPRKMGGTSVALINSPANLLDLCAKCHAWVESNREQAYADGLLLHRLVSDGFNPEEVPVVDGWGHTWHVDHDGTKHRVDVSDSETADFF